MWDELRALRQKVESLTDQAGELRQELLSCLDAAANKPAFAIALARSVVEALAKEMLRGVGLKPPNMLDACIRELERPELMSRGLVPGVILTLLHKVKTFGNKASHGDMPIVLTADHVRSVVGDALLVAQWYLGEFPRGPRLDPVFQPARAGGLFPSGAFLAGSVAFPFSPPLSSGTSRRRSAVLMTLRSSAVIGTTGAAYGVLQFLVKAEEFPSLPALTLFGASVLTVAAVGVLLLVVSGLRIRLAALFARRRQESAMRELAALILARLETPRLLSATSVRRLALGLEQKHRCPILTDKLLAESIRSAAIALEYAARGEVLERGLTLLSELLVSIDENASPLCSIAVVDRLGAYVQSQPILVGALLLALLVTVIRPVLVRAEWSWWTLITVTGLTTVAFLLWGSTERAIRYWRWHEEEAGPDSATKFAPQKPGLLADLFLTASSSRAAWTGVLWNQVWGPLWESVMFLWRSDRQLAAMHEFRFDVAQGLWGELKTADIELEQGPNQGSVERAILEQRFRELARRLWVITGEPQFRVIEARGALRREDRESGIVGLL